MVPNPTPEHPRYVFFFTGPTACGKSTIAKYVADNLNLTFLEGDDFHPKANVDKMHRGEPLTDEDRQGWLEALREHEYEHPPGEKSLHLIMTCSALKRHYRDILRKGSELAENMRVRFIFLEAPEEVLTERAENRKGHFAGAALVHSQFDIIEGAAPDETDVHTIHVTKPVEEVEKAALETVREILQGA
ncbi:hypothetical protein VPNG_09851 [Cytospora leucostoma]|uniref:Gluconokinase n=1 Tax=Cytospora leucostoma TaxID=1230097 RepID=A0A423VIH9_9PEZI|nr:hypothetical protein VPNG_09851 [Cytospora leucostoma]